MIESAVDYPIAALLLTFLIMSILNKYFRIWK